MMRGSFPAGIVAVLIGWTPALAETISSQYTKLDYEKGCTWSVPASEEEAQMGGSAICNGFRGHVVHFAEGDLRQFLAYGPVDDPRQHPGGFSQWNSVHDVIEWRLDGDHPFATIHRWYIENIDPDTGSADPDRRGQVLVVSTVADPFKPAGERQSCVVGYVDAIANKKANELARKLADATARDFVCGVDYPEYAGARGPFSGTPNR